MHVFQNIGIKDGGTSGVKIKKEDDKIKFTLPYPRSADKANHPVFRQITKLGIADVIQFVQKHCDFMSAFTHIKQYHAQDKMDPIAVMACIIANATNLGIHKMAGTSDIAHGSVDGQKLETRMHSFIARYSSEYKDLLLKPQNKINKSRYLLV